MSSSSNAAPTNSESPQEGFRGPQVCKIVGITYRQLDYWARTGLLTPSITAAKGSGTQRRYSYRDVLELKVIKQLLDAGISLDKARTVIEVLGTQLGEDVASANIIMNGAGSVVVKSGEELIDVLRGGQGVLSLVPMSGLVSELDAAITELHATASASPSEAQDSATAIAN